MSLEHAHGHRPKRSGELICPTVAPETLSLIEPPEPRRAIRFEGAAKTNGRVICLRVDLVDLDETVGRQQEVLPEYTCHQRKKRRHRDDDGDERYVCERDRHASPPRCDAICAIRE